MASFALAASGCGLAERIDPEAYDAGEELAEAFLASGVDSYEELIELCTAARDRLRSEFPDTTDDQAFAYILGCKDRVRAEFPEAKH